MLATPWVASPGSARWCVVLVLVLAAVGDVLGRVYGVAHHAWAFIATMLAIGNAACWLLLMPNGLMLALAARRMRLPGISREVAWSLPLYAVLGIGVPMLCQFPQGHALSFALVQILLAVGAMLFMLMPYYLGLALYFAFVISHRALSHVISIPGPSDPRFVPWGGTLAVVLVLMLAWRWRQLLRGDCAERGLRAPGLMAFRRNPGGAQSDPLTDAGSMRVRPDWLLARPDLRDVGPQAVGKSIRTALGGVYLPQTVIGRLYQWIPGVLLLATMGLIFAVVTLGNHDASRLLHYVFSRDGFRAVSWMFAVFSLMIVMLPVELLALRWGRPNAELSLLALLPGLNPAQHGKRLLLRAVMGLPAIRLSLLLAVGWIGAASVDAGWSLELVMLALVLSCLGYLLAMALGIFGGSPLPGVAKALLMIGMFVLLSVSMLLPQIWEDWSARSVTQAGGALAAGWIVIALVLLRHGRRGWHGLQQRSHPFLPL